MFLDAAEVVRNEDVLITTYRSGTTVSEENAMEIDIAQLTLAAGKDMFILADLRNGDVRIDEKAEDFFMTKGKMMPFTKAVAIVGDHERKSVFAKMLRRNRTWYVFKKFNSIEEAMNWFAKLRTLEPQVA